MSRWADNVVQTKLCYAFNTIGESRRLYLEDLPNYYTASFSQLINNVWIIETNPLLNQFIVFSTDSHFWSVEMEGEETILIGILEDIHNINHFTANDKTKEKISIISLGIEECITVHDLVHYIATEELQNKYNFFYSKNERFVKRIYQFMIKNAKISDSTVNNCQKKLYFSTLTLCERKAYYMDELPDYLFEILSKTILKVLTFETSSISKHYFIVLSSDTFHFSLELDGELIAFQIFENIADVRDFAPGGKARDGNVKELNCINGTKTVLELITYLAYDLLEQKYNFFFANSKRFSETMFQYLSKNSLKSRPKWGFEWKSKLVFAVKDFGKGKLVFMDELPQIYYEIFSENVSTVWQYKSPLSSYQPTDFLFYHAFIVFKTTTYYWSVEKDGQWIKIQGFDTVNEVRDYTSGGKARNQNVTILKEGMGKKTVQDLIAYIYYTEIDKKYHFFSSNCQRFAESIYQFITN